MEPTISLVTLGVDDLETSIRFYRDGLGLPMEPREEGADIAFFRLDGSWLSLYPREKLAADATVPAEGSGFSGITIAHNVDSKDEVETILNRAVSAGGRLVKPAQDVFWGGYSGYFADPDDHLWEVAFPPLEKD